MKDSADLEDGELRLLEVDNRVVLPASSRVRVIVTSSDVLHSWAIPSLGVKVDAIPGRLNQVSMMLDREGIYYGQCSELCLRLDRDVDLREDQYKLESRIACPNVLYDVVMRELGLKQVNKMASHELSNLMSKIKTLIKGGVGRWGWSSNLLEAALTVDWDYDGFPAKLLKGLNIKDKVSQRILSSNRKMESIFRGTGLKNTPINSIYISKLGNPVRIQTDLLNLPKKLVPTSREGIWLGKLSNMVAGGKMGTKRTEKGNQNSPAYRSGRDLLALKPLLVTARMYSNISCNKSDNVNRSLTNRVKAEIGKGEWIKRDQRAELIEFISSCQTNLSALGKKGDYNKVNHLMEIMLSSLLFQVYTIETMVTNQGSRTPGWDGKILENNTKSKIEMLNELRKWRNRKPSPLKRIYIPKEDGNRRPISIPSIIDRSIQQLFLLVLDPVVEAKSDSYSFGFRKGRNKIMAIGGIQKKLQSKVREKVVSEGYIWDADIRKCFDTINHAWLMKNTPIPKKFKYILKGWLEAGYVEFGSEKILETKEGVPQGGIISPLLMNICLNGLENILVESMEEYKKGTRTAAIRYRELDGLRLSKKHVGETGKYKERAIDLRMIRYADDLIVISGSARLLNIVKGKFAGFLEERGLEINAEKSRVVELGVNKPFNFLGYTFVYLERTEDIRSKLVHRSSREYRLEGRPRLYVFPSEEKVIRLKLRLKNYLKENQNSEALKIIGELNPIIRGWVNYFSYSNAMGTLGSLRAWLFRRLGMWMKRKHPKAGREWLNRRYFIMEEAKKEYNIKEKDMIEIMAKLKSSEQLKANKWNFYGIAKRSSDGQTYKVPKVNVLLWPDRIKELVTASTLMPGRSILGDSYYLRKEEWLKEAWKFRVKHGDKENKLFKRLWDRDKGRCGICNQPLAEEITDFRSGIELHHKITVAEGGSNKMENQMLAHQICHKAWHVEEGPKRAKERRKISKNRREIE